VSCYFAMVHSRYVIRALCDSGRMILTKLFGMILAVIAVQFVINGVGDVLLDFGLRTPAG
jgi:multiple antibiotic resistance protein